MWRERTHFVQLYDLVHLLARVSEDLVALLCQVSFHHVIQLRVAHPWAIHAYMSEAQPQQECRKGQVCKQPSHSSALVVQPKLWQVAYWTLGPHAHESGRKPQV